MPNFAYDQHSPNSASITVTLTEDELKNELNQELKKLRKKVDLKGFRKGKAPLSALRKMMGNQVLSEIVDKGINGGLQEYLEENKIDLIFAPMIKDDQQIGVDARLLKEVSVDFDLALKPPFELTMPSEPLTRYVLKVDDELVDESLNNLLKRQGEQQEMDEPIQAEDIIVFQAQELAEDGQPKEGGVESQFETIFEDLNEELQEQLEGKSAGETFEYDVFDFERNASEHVVRKHMLKLEDEALEFGPRFKFRTQGIKRLVPAELNEEFFAKFDPEGKITDEAALRDRIAQDNRDGFAQQGDTLLKNEATRYLVENTEIDLPTELLDRVRKEEGGKPERFERGVRWMLIRGKYASDNEIELQPEDLRAASDARLMGMLGGQRADWITEEFLENWLKRSLEDEQQRNDLVYDALERKITNHLVEQLPTKEEEVTAERFNEIIQEFNAQYEEEE